MNLGTLRDLDVQFGRRPRRLAKARAQRTAMRIIQAGFFAAAAGIALAAIATGG